MFFDMVKITRFQHCYILLLLSMPGVALPAAYVADGFNPVLDVSIVRDNSVSKAWLDKDVIKDNISKFTLGGAYSSHVKSSGMVVLSGYISQKVLSEYDRLDSLDVSLGLQYHFQNQTGYSAPAYRIGIEVVSLNFSDSELREGELYDLNLGFGKRLALGWFINVDFDLLRRQAESKVFETRQQLFTVSPEYRLNGSTILYSEFQFVTGDMVAAAFGEPGFSEASLAADAADLDPVFDDLGGAGENWSYRYKGDGYVATLGLLFLLPNGFDLDLSARYYDFEADADIGYSDWSLKMSLAWSF